MNPFQKEMIRVYGGGWFADAKGEEDFSGDTLALFLFRELEDVEDAECANARLEKAIQDLSELYGDAQWPGEEAAA